MSKTIDLVEIIERRDKEIHDIKQSIAEVLKQIVIINESNTYGNENVKKRKISELCKDTIYELLIDEKEMYPVTTPKHISKWIYEIHLFHYFSIKSGKGQEGKEYEYL